MPEDQKTPEQVKQEQIERRRARRKAQRERRKSQKDSETPAKTPRPQSTRKARALIDVDHYQSLLLTSLAMPIDEAAGDRSWFCFSIPYLARNYTNPSEAAEMLKDYLAGLDVPVEQIAVLPGGLLGFGPVAIS